MSGIGRSRRPPQRDLRQPSAFHFATIGTSADLSGSGISSLFHVLTIPGGRWLCPRANAPRPALPPGPSALGAYVTISSALMDDAIASEVLALASEHPTARLG